MALDKVKQGVIADDAVGSSQIAPDTVVAADIGANAITASELADNAVDTAAIASNAVTTAKITDANITTAKVANSAITSLKLGDVIDTAPHIIPGVLHPAVAGKLLDGTTSHSGDYGTAQSDGRKYYYTDIKGSKPIKDPRIGGHFGSQRYKFKSLQLLEQETATYGNDVFSIDGREWCRLVNTGSVKFQVETGDAGNGLNVTSHTFTAFFEITGYFNDFNCISWTKSDRADDIDITVNGGTVRGSANTNKLAGRTAFQTPLNGRYVDAGSVINHGDSDVASDLGTTPSINTIKIEASNTASEYWRFYGIELIAQDTTSTANRSKIQIPSQNVVSYGKKFTVSATHHYNPFALNQAGTAVAIGNTSSHGSVATGWTGTGAGYFDDTLDTSTSLGLSAWEQNSKYYRPINGGRVVKWVDSSGNIKTSVNVMPPAGTSIGVSSDTNTPEANSWTTQSKPLFSSTTIDHTQAEVAKTFHFREFGNGGANGSASYKDASVISTSAEPDIGYVMDDGLTSLAADDVSSLETPANALNLASNDRVHITFIGTGISIFSPNWAENANAWHHIAQNLPYGTHILRIFRAADNNSTILLDGVEVKGSTSTAPWKNPSEITFHQPKRPPIPEDACVLADYMLMADYIPQADAEDTEISKGLRLVGASRDIKYDGAIHSSHQVTVVSVGYLTGLHTGVSPSSGGTPLTLHLPFFGTNIQYSGHGTPAGARTYTFTTGASTGSSVTKTSLDNSTAVDADMDVIANSGLSLGQHTVNITMPNGGYSTGALLVVSPIHTSSHYQTFETDFLHELVGGDRNMEQTNLVCSPDGKTWDEITRDTSYIGNVVASMNTSDATTWSTMITFDDWRGHIEGKEMFNKDFAISYNHLICLRTGFYLLCDVGSFDGHREWYLKKKGESTALHITLLSSGTSAGSATPVFLHRGDEVYLQGDWGFDDDTNRRYNHAYILRSDA